MEAHERGEREDGDLRGEQAETQRSSNIHDEQHDGERAGSGPGTESQEARIDPTAERAHAKSEAGHEVSEEWTKLIRSRTGYSVRPAEAEGGGVSALLSDFPLGDSRTGGVRCALNSPGGVV
jgi:hypothetical protein